MFDEGPGSTLERPKIDIRDFVRVGTPDWRTFSEGRAFSCFGSGVLAWGVWGSEAAASNASEARACSTFLTPARISAVDAPWGAVVTSVSVGRIFSSLGSSFSLVISSSVTRRSFSSRTSRPRLWQYQSTNRRTG